MVSDDPAAIAARMSPAQRRALLWLPGDGISCVNAEDKNAPHQDDRLFLRAMGLMAAPSKRARYATHLGLAVRAVLEAEATHAPR